MLNEKNGIRADEVKRDEVEEMVKTLLKLPVAEREKLFYIMKGVELTVDRMPERRAV